MQRDTDETIKELWKDEIAVRKEAHTWETISDVGFIGLVATEIPEFFARNGARKSAWRLPLFVASGVSVAVGVVMNWIKGNKADELRESVLMIEHTPDGEQGAMEANQWRAKIAAQQDAPQVIAK